MSGLSPFNGLICTNVQPGEEVEFSKHAEPNADAKSGAGAATTTATAAVVAKNGRIQIMNQLLTG